MFTVALSAFALLFLCMMFFVSVIKPWMQSFKMTPAQAVRVFSLALCFLTLSLVSFSSFAVDPASTESISWLTQLPEFLIKIPEYLNLVVGVISALIALCLIIPGEQPEKALQKVVDFLSKFSKKK